VRRRFWEENFGKYVDNSFNIAAGDKCRSGNAGMTASFCKKKDKMIHKFELIGNRGRIQCIKCRNFQVI